MVAVSLAFFILDKIIEVTYATITRPTYVTEGPRITLSYIIVTPPVIRLLYWCSMRRAVSLQLLLQTCSLYLNFFCSANYM